MISILSVDDSKAVHAYLRSCFDDKVYDLHHALSGKEAINLLKNNLTKYQIILLDWEMPDLSGPETLVELKKLGVTVPIIMVTTRNKEQDIKAVLEKGASEFVMKPFTADIIQQKVQDFLG